MTLRRLKARATDDNLRHTHLLIRATTPRDIVPRLSERLLREHLLALVDSIGMRVLVPPQVRYSGSDGNTGFTGLVGITTSHMSFHHWDGTDPGILQLDSFSCRPFQIPPLIREIRSFWSADIDEAVLITRYPIFEVRRLSIDDLNGANTDRRFAGAVARA
jgi:hypothetical protein